MSFTIKVRYTNGKVSIRDCEGTSIKAKSMASYLFHRIMDTRRVEVWQGSVLQLALVR